MLQLPTDNKSICLNRYCRKLLLSLSATKRAKPSIISDFTELCINNRRKAETETFASSAGDQTKQTCSVLAVG
jgi:hypothetical protein